MELNPKHLALPEYAVEEINRCRGAIEPGMFGTGLIVDGNNVMYRLAFAASKDVSNEHEMLAVFVDRIKIVVKEVNADVVVCCIDSGVSLRRSMLGAKKKPDKTPEQQAVVDLAREALHLLRLQQYSTDKTWLNPRWQEGYEADDLCAAWAVSGHFVHSVLYSTDSDLFQVTNGSGITQLSPASGRFLTSDVPPELVPGVKALAGDSSDNVIGVDKIGPVTALKIMTGKTTVNLIPETELRVRNNLTLTTLPFPGAYQCLEGAPLLPVPRFNEFPETDADRLGLDSDPTPF